MKSMNLCHLNMDWRVLGLILFVFICVYERVSDEVDGTNSRHVSGPNATNEDAVANTVNVVLIVCERPDGKNDMSEHMAQVNTLLKTIFLLSTSPVTIYFLHNQEDLFMQAVRTVNDWGVETKHKIRLQSVIISYPEHLESMTNTFKTCSPARLFIHEMLPDVDAAIFLDTDVVLMDNIHNLWDYFSQFNSAQVLGMAATENIYNEVKSIPFYGPPGVGLNTGVMLMNLTRMRAMSGAGFTGSVRWVYGRYKSQLRMAEQDIMNIIFGMSYWYLFELPCTWNYVMWQCRVDSWAHKDNPRTWVGKNQCIRAEKHGVSLVHGNPVKFGKSFELVFKAVHSFWLDHNPAQDSLVHTLPELRDSIREVVDMEEDASPCSNVFGIENILLDRLESLVQTL